MLVRMTYKVTWPGISATNVYAWRLLDLSGMTHSVRESQRYTRAGYVFLNGEPITLRTTVRIGDTVKLEIRLPDGRRTTLAVMAVNRPHWPGQNSRVPIEYHRKG